MHRFSRMHLSPVDAMRKLDAIDLEEKTRIAEGIALIAVIDHRRDYLGAGYSCMRDYCMGRMHMSEDQAFRRIQVARVGLEHPEIFECLADGRLGVTTAAELAPHVNAESASGLIAAAAFKSKDEIRSLVAERERSRVLASAPAGPSQVSDVESVSGSLAPAQVNLHIASCAPPAANDNAGSAALALAGHTRRGRVFSSGSGGHEVQLSITDEEHADLRQAQVLLGHAVPSGDPAVIYARAMKHYVAHLEKRRLGAKPASATSVRTAGGRGIPKPLRRFVWERDGGRCAFMSTDGHRCESTRRLEVDHIQPVALGGETKPENLRLLCRAHNQYEAERVFGKERVHARRELASRERARAKAAAEASAARAKARIAVREGAAPALEREQADANAVTSNPRETATAMPSELEAHASPRHPDHDDLVTALLGLGFKQAEARRGAKLAESMPNATLEACLKLALTELTRPVAIRGERRAKCTA